jgi:hypothetical protein
MFWEAGEEGLKVAGRGHTLPDVTDPSDTRDRDVARAVKLADWLDDRYIDPIVGFVLPEVGDLLMSLVGLYPVFLAIRHKLPAVVVARMIRNLAIDALVGAVPLLGDAFDVVWKANRKNADLLLERHVLGPSPLSDWAAVIGAALVLLVGVALPFVIVAYIVRLVTGGSLPLS